MTHQELRGVTEVGAKLTAVPHQKLHTMTQALSKLYAERMAYLLWFKHIGSISSTNTEKVHISKLLRKVNQKIIDRGGNLNRMVT